MSQPRREKFEPNEIVEVWTGAATGEPYPPPANATWKRARVLEARGAYVQIEWLDERGCCPVVPPAAIRKVVVSSEEFDVFGEAHLTDVPGYAASWGACALTLVPRPTRDVRGADGVPLEFVVRATFGDSRDLEFGVRFEGQFRILAIESVRWTGDPTRDRQIWNARFDKHRGLLDRCVEIARAGGNPADEDRTI